MADHRDLDDLIGRLRKDARSPTMGQVGDSFLKAAAGFVSLGVPTRRSPLSPEQQRKQALGCWLSFVVWGGAVGLGILAGYLYDRAPSSSRTVHLIVGGGLGVLGVMVLGLVVAVAAGIRGLARRGH